MSLLNRRFRNPLDKKRRRGFRGYPLATVAFYGPDDKRASKAVVGIFRGKGQDVALLKRWYSEHGDARFDPAIIKEMVAFISEQGAITVTGVDGIYGCPHEEGIDYPDGEPCPACPYWAHRDRLTGKIEH